MANLLQEVSKLLLAIIDRAELFRAIDDDLAGIADSAEILDEYVVDAINGNLDPYAELSE